MHIENCEGWLSPGGHSSGGRALTATVRGPRFNHGWLPVLHMERERERVETAVAGGREGRHYSCTMYMYMYMYMYIKYNYVYMCIEE